MKTFVRQFAVFLVFIGVFIPLFAGASFTKDLHYGMRQEADVKKLQEFLTSQSIYSGPITGNFFILTKEAVQKFQKLKGISPTGHFDNTTRMKVNDILVPIVTTPLQQASLLQNESKIMEKFTAELTAKITAQFIGQIEALQKQLKELQSQQESLIKENNALKDRIAKLEPPPPDLSKIDVKVSGPTNIDPTKNRPFGEYIFEVSVFGKDGNQVNNARIFRYIKDDDDYFTFYYKNFGEANPNERYAINTAFFPYAPQKKGLKNITFISSPLIKTITLEVN